MKTPNANQNGQNNNNNNQSANDRYDATQVSIQEANSRALQARDEALALRQKLETMESLLAVTKTKLALTKDTLEMKDQRLQEVRLQTAIIHQSLNGLDERFANLKKLQGVLAEKRDKLFPPDASDGASTSSEEPAQGSEATLVEAKLEERTPEAMTVQPNESIVVNSESKELVSTVESIVETTIEEVKKETSCVTEKVVIETVETVETPNVQQ